MKIKNKYALFFFVTLFLVVVILTGAAFYKKNSNLFDSYLNTKVPNTPQQIFISPTLSLPSPTPIEYTLDLVSIPQEITQGDNVAFTWQINGPKRKIKTTTVYYGTASTPGKLTKDILPLQTKYSDYLKEFISGEYEIPLVFVGNNIMDKSGFRRFSRTGING